MSLFPHHTPHLNFELYGPTTSRFQPLSPVAAYSTVHHNPLLNITIPSHLPPCHPFFLKQVGEPGLHPTLLLSMAERTHLLGPGSSDPLHISSHTGLHCVPTSRPLLLLFPLPETQAQICTYSLTTGPHSSELSQSSLSTPTTTAP